MKSIDSKNCNVKFGEFIKAARECQKMSQVEVAEKIGITQVYLSHIERGDRNVDLVLALKICDVVKADMQSFVSRYL